MENDDRRKKNWALPRRIPYINSTVSVTSTEGALLVTEICRFGNQHVHALIDTSIKLYNKYTTSSKQHMGLFEGPNTEFKHPSRNHTSRLTGQWQHAVWSLNPWPMLRIMCSTSWANQAVANKSDIINTDLKLFIVMFFFSWNIPSSHLLPLIHEHLKSSPATSTRRRGWGEPPPSTAAVRSRRPQHLRGEG